MQNSIEFGEIEMRDLLGRGMFGAVFTGKWKDKEVAVKQIFTDTTEFDVQFYFTREVEILSSVSHPNIVQFYGISTDSDNLYIITELIKGSNLRIYLKETEVTWPDRLKIAIQMASAIDYLHRNNIIHRDVKTENVLIDNAKKTVKLCDFGFSRSNDDDSKKKTFCGSEWFEAPEIMFCMDYDQRVDIFSYGVVLCELISKVEPSISVFRREVPGFGLNNDEIRSRANEGIPEEVFSVIFDCVAADPDQRMPLPRCISKLKEIYGQIAGKPYSELDDEIQVAEKHLLERGGRPMSMGGFPTANLGSSALANMSHLNPRRLSSNTSSENNDTTQPRRNTLPGRYSARLSVYRDDVVLNSSNNESFEDQPSALKSVSNPEVNGTYTANALLNIARLQSLDTANIKGIIPQKDQLAWRSFLLEFRSSLKVRDIQKSSAMKLIKTYRNCFTGSEAIDWLVTTKKTSREEGVELARILVKLNVIRQATPTGTTGGTKSIFRDSKDELYRFSDDGIFFRQEKAPTFLKKFTYNSN